MLWHRVGDSGVSRDVCYKKNMVESERDDYVPRYLERDVPDDDLGSLKVVAR